MANIYIYIYIHVCIYFIMNLLRVVFRTEYTALHTEFHALGLRNYVTGLEFLQSQPQNSFGVGFLTPECSGVHVTFLS